MESFADILAADQSLAGERVQSLMSQVQLKNFKKGEILQLRGDAVKNYYFVKSGLLRAYTIDSRGREHIYLFAPEGWIVADIASTLIEEPLYLTIDALENSEVEVFRAGDLDDVFAQVASQDKEFANREITRLLKRMSVLQKRILMLLSFTAYERYEEFNKTYPGLVQRVPQKMIASYLGITPESLSKIKRQNLKKK